MMNPTFIVQIIVKARNEIAAILQKAASDVDSLTKAQDRQTASQKRQADASKSTAAAMTDATKRFEAYTAEVEKGTKSGEAAEKQLRSFASEFDNLGRRAKAGSVVSDSFFQMGRQAKVMADQVRVAERQMVADAQTTAKQRASARQSEADAMVRSIRQELAADAQRDKQFLQNLANHDATARRSIASNAAAQEKAEKQDETLLRAQTAAVEREAAKQATAVERAAKQAAAASVAAEKQRQVEIARTAKDAQAASQAAQRALADYQKLENDLTRSIKSLQGAKTDTARGLASSSVSSSAGNLRDSGVSNRDIGSIVDNVLGRDSKSKLTEAQRGIHDLAGSLDDLDRSAPKQGFLSRIFGDIDPEKVASINKMLGDFEDSANRSSFSAVKLAGNLRGMVIIGALVFFQQLAGAAIALGGALVSIASAAVQAGAALGGALVAGAAQALPVVGLLAGAWARVSAVLNAVQQQQKAQRSASADATTAANQQASAADSLASAQEGLAQAHRQVTVAQEALTLARFDAVRQIQDLVTAEKEAVLQAEASKLALSDAQSAFSTALRSGDTSSLAGDALQVRSARLQSSTSARDSSRAAFDANKAVGLGVSGQLSVVSAQRALDDANRGVGDAQRQLEAARRSALTAAADVGSARKTLDQLLAQLSPAEKGLYDALTKLLARYKTVFTGRGGVLETIIGAFTFGVQRANVLLDDPKLIATARRLAGSISTELRKAFSFLTGPRQVGFIEQMSDDARRNLPVLEQIIEHVAKLLENIAKAASPALHAFLTFLDDLSGKADKATGSDSGIVKLQRFFSQGERFAESFVKLGIAIGGLFLAIIGTSAKQGQGAIQSITKSIQDATKWIDDHQKQVRNFFSQAIASAGDVMSTLGSVAKFLFSMFSPKQIKDFVDVLKNTVIPALSSIFTVVGKVSDVISKVLGSKVGRTLVDLGLAFFALSKYIKLVIAPVVALIGAFGLLTSADGAVEAALVLFDFALGPIGLAITAVAAAVLLLNGKFHFLGPTIAFIKTVAVDVFDWLKVHWPLLLTILGGPIGAAVTLIVKHWDAIKKGVSNAVDAIVGYAVSFGKRFVAQVEKYAGELLAITPGFVKAGVSMAAGLIKGFAGDLITFFKSIGVWLFNNVIKPIYDFFEISSPSKYFERIGTFLIRGLINGLGTIASDLAGLLVSLGEDIVKLIVKGIENAPSALVDAVKGLASHLPIVGGLFGGSSGVKDVGASSIPRFGAPARTKGAVDPAAVIAGSLNNVPDDSTSQAAFVKQWTVFWQKVVAIVVGGKTTIDAQFVAIQRNATQEITDLYNNVRDTLIELQTSFEYRSQSIVDVWDSAWQDIQTITYKGLAYVAKETNTALKALGSKAIDFGLAAPQFDNQSDTTVQTHATGGPVRGPGTGTSDSIPARLSDGEHVWTAREVANAGGHGAVMAMRRMFGGGGNSGGAGFATGGAVTDDHSGDLTQGQEPQLLTAVKRLASYLHTTIEIISAYRTPQHSVAVGGFADDPHTLGEAMDIGVPGGFLYSNAADSIMARFGLYRPFYPASAKEYDHVQLLSGAAAGIKGSVLAGAGAAKPSVDALKRMLAPHVQGNGAASNLVQSMLTKVFGAARRKVSGSQSAGASGSSAFTGTLSGSVEKQVFEFFKANGFNKVAIAGMLGNALQESDLNWSTPGGGLWQQVTNFGQGAPSPLVQMQTMLPQILGIRAAMNSAGSPAAAATLFMNSFERPDVSLENLPRRIAGAIAAYASGYAKGGAVRGEDSEDPSTISKMAGWVSSYLDTGGGFQRLGSMFPGVPKVSISSRPGNMIKADIYDIEAQGGGHTVAETIQALTSGLTKGVYGGASDIAAVGAGVRGKVKSFVRWLAQWPSQGGSPPPAGYVPAVPPGYDAHQYAGDVPTPLGSVDYDIAAQSFFTKLGQTATGVTGSTDKSAPSISLRSVLAKLVAPHVGGDGPATRLAQRILGNAYGSARGQLKNGMAAGGSVSGPGTGTSDSVWARLSDGEHVWTAAEVAKAGGHQVMYALRGMLGGGGQGGPGYATGGGVSGYTEPSIVGTTVSSTLRGTFAQIAAASGIAAALSTDSKYIGATIATLTKITESGGVLDQLDAAIQALSDKLAANLQRVTYRITRSGEVVQKLTAAQVADRSVENLQAVYARLLAQSTVLRSEIAANAKEINAKGLTAAQKAKLQSEQVELNKHLDAVRSSISDNVAATYQAEQDAISAHVDAINSKADAATAKATSASARISVRQRVRALVGGTALTASGAPSNEAIGKQQKAIDDAQAAALRAQASSLDKQAKAAAKSGNTDLAKQLKQQIAGIRSSISDLTTSGMEAVAAGISADVDEINRQADRTTAAIGVKQRIATALGNTDQLAALDTQQAAADQQQIVALKAKQAAALKKGDTALAEQIGDQIDGLTASVIEAGAQAVSDATDQINKVYTAQQAGIDIRSRIATALGDVNGISTAIGEQINSIQNQAKDLTAQMAAATAAGDTGLAEQIKEQIADLDATVTELTAQRLQNAIDAVNNTASRQAAAVGLTNRLADLQEKAGSTAAAFAMRASALATTGTDLTSQRDQLQGLLVTAQQEGNQTDIASLSDSIADLDVQIQENTTAIEENTTAARQAAIDAITNRGSFLGGVYGGIQTLVTTLGQLAGTTNVDQLKGLLGQAGTTLQQTGSGLLASLKSDFGIDLTGQSPTQLAASLSGLNYDGAEAGMPADVKTQFEGLINAIIDNTNSQVSNTQQLAALTAADTQTFTSTAWQWFRNAIFDGAGGLLPQYQNAALGITTAMPGGGATPATAALAAVNSTASSSGDTFAPTIVNEERTVDMDAETLSSRLLFQYKNRPRS